VQRHQTLYKTGSQIIPLAERQNETEVTITLLSTYTCKRARMCSAFVLRVTEKSPQQTRNNQSLLRTDLVHLNVNVDVANKLEGGEERHRPKHQEENIAS